MALPYPPIMCVHVCINTLGYIVQEENKQRGQGLDVGRHFKGRMVEEWRGGEQWRGGGMKDWSG